jgi:hypothetical protein
MDQIDRLTAQLDACDRALTRLGDYPGGSMELLAKDLHSVRAGIQSELDVERKRRG